MAKFFDKRKGKKRLITALSLLLSATLTLGVVSACTTAKEKEEDDDKKPSATDTQLLKNGNFEFYSEMDEEDRDERRAFINSPSDWSFSSGSPSSDTSSGIVNTADWEYMSQSSFKLVPEKEDQVEKPELTSAVIANAKANWEKASVYDRLEFYDYYNIDSANDFELYSDYRYSIDFEDLEYLHEVSTEKPLLYENADREEGKDESILMIHNHRTSDGVRGTAQYYTSSTTITLHAGTAAKVSVWVRTSELYHYAATAEGENDVAVTRRAGAYIGVTNTVGGNSLDQMQIKNINTHDEWQQYTVYIRANTFASTTFRIVLGLGQGSSDNRYEAVDGYAFFDDVACEIISGTAYEDAVKEQNLTLPENSCDLDSKGDDKKFFATDNETGAQTEYMTYALDLHTGFEAFKFNEYGDPSFGLTEEVSGSKTYTSASIDSSLGENNDVERGNIADFVSLSDISGTSNGYLRNIYENDFKDKFPFENTDNIVLLLSANGAAYTAKLPTIEVQPKHRMLVSFFVKTSKIRSGKTGASAILVDGSNKSTISAFDTTTVSPVDIDSDSEDASLKDIYKGWVQCFFFVQNDTEELKEFHIELTYGPTAIASSAKTDYADGYAAFANFQQRELSKSQYSYAATGTYAQKVSLTASVRDSSKFDNASANGPQLEEGLAIPASYTGVLAGSNILVDSEKDEDGNIINKNPSREKLANEYGIYTGLLSSEYADKYLDTSVEDGASVPAWKTALNGLAGGATDPDTWWKTIFGNNGTTVNAAYQPLVILNTSDKAQPSYGFFASKTTVAANAASRISVRVKLSKGASAYIYLTDVSDVKKGFDNRLAPTLPKATYWYDDEGNIVKCDPTSDEFDKDTDILYTLEENGLYKKVGDESETYYANLSAFGEPNDEGNLVTKSGTIAYYGHEGKFYAYYDKSTDTYSQEVIALPTDEGIRYPEYLTLNQNDYSTVIKVEGTEENADQWVTVSFYVQAGNQTKNYRLELWAGQRTNTTSGIPAGGYVFFDRCNTGSVSNFSTLMNATASALKDELNVKEKDNLPLTKDGKPLALYYTFTFFDSPDYLRYDATEDEDELGNPWGSYEQSAHSEQLMWLYCEDDGSLLGTAAPTVSLYMSYAANEVTVTPDELGNNNSSNNGSNNNNTTTTQNPGETNIWLLLSSILLAAALVFAIVAVIVRRVVKKHKKSSVAPKKAKTPKAPKAETVKTEVTKDETKSTSESLDDNDPYNE